MRIMRSRDQVHKALGCFASTKTAGTCMHHGPLAYVLVYRINSLVGGAALHPPGIGRFTVQESKGRMDVTPGSQDAWGT